MLSKKEPKAAEPSRFDSKPAPPKRNKPAPSKPNGGKSKGKDG